VSDDKRTRIGTGPVRPPTAGGHAVAARVTPAPGTPAPTTDPPGAATSYLPPQTDPLLGQVLAGRYVIHKKLGEGGMGAVYLATHNLLEKQVALKVLHGEFARKPDLVERFMQEAKSASRIRHENVIDISDFGSTPEGLVFFAMELLKGHDLHEEVARARLAAQLLPWERSKRIFLQICAALNAAHALGIIHRDLKPENIYLVDFLGEPDFVKLLDFGIAKQTEVGENDRKLTKTGMLFGTPEYMSPEQARGESMIDARVDVYAMGCILYQLVTGRVPFEAENFMGVLSLHLTEPPPMIPPEVFDSIGAPRALAGVIDQALAKDRNLRFSSIEELARAVRRVSGDKLTAAVVAQPNVANTATMNRVKTQWTGNLSVPELDAAAPPRRSKLPLILGAVVLLGGGAGAAAFFATRGGEPPVTASAGRAAMAIVAPPVQPPVQPPPPVIPATLPALTFEWSHIRIDSQPPAEVTDLALGKVIGRTPFRVKVRPSRTPRQFELHAKNHVASIVELIPDREHIEHVEKLERGAGRKVSPNARPVPKPDPDRGSAVPAVDPPVIKPDPTTPVPTTPAVDPPVIKADPIAKPPVPGPDDDCGDPPCLKADPSRPGSGGATAPGP
jgi:serine/threonine-protein kinase